MLASIQSQKHEYKKIIFVTHTYTQTRFFRLTLELKHAFDRSAFVCVTSHALQCVTLRLTRAAVLGDNLPRRCVARRSKACPRECR